MQNTFRDVRFSQKVLGLYLCNKMYFSSLACREELNISETIVGLDLILC